MLKTLYGSAFTLIGVVCDDKIRQERIQEKYLSGAEKKDDVSQKKLAISSIGTVKIQLIHMGSKSSSVFTSLTFLLITHKIKIMKKVAI